MKARDTTESTGSTSRPRSGSKSKGATGGIRSMAMALTDKLPPQVKNTLYLRFFGFFKIPMLFFISPSVMELSDFRCVVKVPLTRRSKNHLNSMYFGALSAGADCAGGLMAMRMIHELGDQAALIFKDFRAEFLKRAEGDTYFTCEQGTEIRQFVQNAIDTGERENMKVHVIATVPSKLGEEPVAKFELTLSVKRKKANQESRD